MHSDLPILIDVSRLLWRRWRNQLPTGIDRACLAYVEHFRERAVAVVQRGGFTVALDKQHSVQLFDLLQQTSRSVRLISLRYFLLNFLCRIGIVNQACLSGTLYLNVGHTGLDRAGHGRWIRKSGVRAVYYVHDLIPVTHPQFAREGEPERHAARMRTVLKHASAVIANSDDSIERLKDFARAEKLNMPPALCVPLGAADLQPTDDMPRPLPKPYFVTIGTIEGRKNHMLLLNIWRQLIAGMGEDAPRLIIIGQRGWAADDVFEMLDKDETLRGHVTELGRCDDAELHRYLAHAQALLFPSFVEGQGLPLIEALGAGTPVIASDLAVFRETAGDVPEYLDPNDEDGWMEMIGRYAGPESAPRAAQITRMAVFRAPTWAEHFEKVESWLAETGLLRNSP